MMDHLDVYWRNHINNTERPVPVYVNRQDNSWKRRVVSTANDSLLNLRVMLARLLSVLCFSGEVTYCVRMVPVPGTALVVDPRGPTGTSLLVQIEGGPPPDNCVGI
jgi:hypothetical protein